MNKFLISSVLLMLCSACASVRSADLSIWGDPPAHLKNNIVTKVEWMSATQVAIRCADLLASFGKVPMPAYGCTYKQPQEEITLVLPYDLHPLIVHELAHAHQITLGQKVSHQGWQRMKTPK